MRIAIMGLARSGLAAAKLALKLGYSASVSDAGVDHGRKVAPSPELLSKAEELRKLGAEVELGGHTEKFLEGADALVISPGVPDTAAPLQWARERGIEIIGETEFAARHCKGRIAAVTGTNGKTTTTSLISHILDVAGVPHVTCGNIGTPLSEKALETGDGHVVVLELSSFQLETISVLSPFVSVWLNLTPDHLDRYGSVEEYRSAKENIFRRQKPGTYAVVWREEREHEEALIKECGLKPVYVDETGRSRTVQEGPRAVLENGEFVLRLEDGAARSCGRAAEMRLKGRHNHINLLCAMTAAALLGVDPEDIRRACMSFSSLPHRIEEVASTNGVTFVDDSKGTNPEATVEAVLAFPRPVALILGGYDKGSDYAMLIPHMKESVEHVILLGATSDKFQQIFGGEFHCVRAGSMEEAVRLGLELLPEGGTVLLSPACASFDMYKNYEVRGDDFAAKARAICQQPTNPQSEESI